MALFFILDKILQESRGWIIFVICIIGWKKERIADCQV